MNLKLSAFSINTIFVVFMLLGITLIPKIPLQLTPSSRSNTLSVSFTWPDANPELLEMEVTSKLEGAFSRIKGLADISSNTRQGYGTITLSIDKTENIDAVKLHLSSIIRSLAKGLPEGVTVYGIRGGEMKGGREVATEHHLLLNYVITGPGSTQDVALFAEDHIAAVLSQIPGVESVSVTGAVPYEWVLLYEPKTLEEIKVTVNDIVAALNNYYVRQDAGKVLVETVPDKNYSYILFRGNPATDKTDFLEIPIKTVNGKVIFLKNIVTLDYRESTPDSYYRINGLNRININTFNEKNANIIDLSAKVRQKMDEITGKFAENYTVNMTYDSSTELEDELSQNLLRTLVTIIILLLFVWFTSRSLRYLLIIATCLSANILIALVFYYFLEIEIHLYALAGVTVSFGIIIDNVIVMADHYRHHHNRKIFMAILAATLTTMGALVVIFNMDNAVMLSMWGFSAVIIINLALSVVIALFFVPALMEKLPLKEQEKKKQYRIKRRIVHFTCGYARTIRFTKRFRTILLILILLSFGLPVFLIPTTIERDKPFAEFYNSLFGSEIYLQAKPWIDKILGGSLRLFVESSGANRMQQSEERGRTTLNLTMTMPHGASLEQMNEAFIKVEDFLAGFKEIETFTSDISSPNLARMTITLKKEYETGGSPEMLKYELIRFANTIGNADSDISGIGRGFSNSTNDEYRNEKLKVIGYNYRKVLLYANQLKEQLEQQKRVKKLYIGSNRNPDKSKEFFIEVDKEKLAKNNADISLMLWHLGSLSRAGDSRTSVYIQEKLAPIVIRPVEKTVTSLWELQNSPMRGDKSVFRLEDVGGISEEETFEAITKTNQEYEVLVHYDFIGDYMLSNKVKERVMEKMNRDMPVGFRIKEGNEWNYWHWRGAGGIDARIWYILLVITIIYFICAILLESLKQAWIVIVIAPISFIGCFLGFYFFGLRFNEGGLAAFILMCGLSVNAILYIINDYNNKLKAGRPRGLQTYVKAYNAKIIPILLTIVSTLLGFTPFLIGEVSEFWFSLAVGTMSGLAFSLFVLIFILPVFFGKGDKRAYGQR